MTASLRVSRTTVRAVSRGSRQVAFATWVALLWGAVWGGRVEWDRESALLICHGMRTGYGRGGTCVGAVFLTGPVTPGRALADPRRRRALLTHEAVHAEQWRRYGVSFAIRYLVEEVRRPGAANRFEIEAGLTDGGYRR